MSEQNRAPNHRSGFVALAGRPNVGKSTLLNALVGQTIAISTHHPQTTRTRIRGIVNRERAQLIFVDTPGIHKRKRALNKFMLDESQSALGDVDLVVLLIEASGRGTRPLDSSEDQFVLKMLGQQKCKSVLAINKIDKLKDKSQLLPLVASYHKMDLFEEIVPISALRNIGLTQFLEVIENLLPTGPQYFPTDMVTDQPERNLAAEFIREQAMLRLGEELPYSVATEIEEFRELPGRQKFFRIAAVIYVERDSQKGIIIGKNGSMLREIGKAARRVIEKMLDCRIHLELRVKVARRWSYSDGGLSRVGYRKS